MKHVITSLVELFLKILQLIMHEMPGKCYSSRIFQCFNKQKEIGKLTHTIITLSIPGNIKNVNININAYAISIKKFCPI